MLALTRAVPRSIDRCELTHLDRTTIDYARAVTQHAAYEDALRRVGCRVQRLPGEPDFPDSVFVEDTAVVFDQVAVIARPGAESRRGEVDAVAAALGPYRPLKFIDAPGTLDGGDVLVTGQRVFIGISGRTNPEGARQLAAHVAPFGIEVVPVPVEGCLHLKSAVTPVASAFRRKNQLRKNQLRKNQLRKNQLRKNQLRKIQLLINPLWIDAGTFADCDLIEIDSSEPFAANVLSVNGYVICAEEHPRTRARLEARGFAVVPVPAGELAQAEGGVTCCSLLIVDSSS